MHIGIPSESFFEYILQRIDDFITAVEDASNVTKLTIGCTGRLVTETRCQLFWSRENSVALSKFCKAMGNIEGLDTLGLGGFGTTNVIIRRYLFSSLPNIKTILVDLPWRADIQLYHGLLSFAISNHPNHPSLDIRLIDEAKQKTTPRS